MATTTRPTALVTGCTSGIGRELVDLLAASGHDLVLVSRNEAKLVQLAAIMAARYSVAAQVIVADLAVVGSAQRVIDAVTERGLVIDLLVNNAGIGMYGAVVEANLTEQTRMIQLNSVTPTELCSALVRDMVKRGRGQILNIASTVAYQPAPYMAVYGASKVFLLNFSEALAKEVEDAGVTVTAVSPGPTNTDFFSHLGRSSETVGHFASERRWTPRRVAEVALAALAKKRLSKIVGTKNFFLASSSRFASRSLTAKISKSFMSPRTAMTKA